MKYLDRNAICCEHYELGEPQTVSLAEWAEAAKYAAQWEDLRQRPEIIKRRLLQKDCRVL